MAEVAEDEEGLGVITEDVRWESGVAAVVKSQGNDYSMEVENFMDKLRSLATSNVVSENEISIDANGEDREEGSSAKALTTNDDQGTDEVASTLISFFSDTTSLVARLLSSSMPFSTSTE